MLLFCIQKWKNYYVSSHIILYSIFDFYVFRLHFLYIVLIFTNSINFVLEMETIWTDHLSIVCKFGSIVYQAYELWPSFFYGTASLSFWFFWQMHKLHRAVNCWLKNFVKNFIQFCSSFFFFVCLYVAVLSLFWCIDLTFSLLNLWTNLLGNVSGWHLQWFHANVHIRSFQSTSVYWFWLPSKYQLIKCFDWFDFNQSLAWFQTFHVSKKFRKFWKKVWFQFTYFSKACLDIFY